MHEAVGRLAASLSGLNISGDANVIHIALNLGTGSSNDGGNEGAAASSPPAPPGPHPVPGRGERYYVVTHSPQAPELVGINVASWAAVLDRLPGGRLFGSGARCKAFDSLEGALGHWRDQPRSRGAAAPPIRRLERLDRPQ